MTISFEDSEFFDQQFDGLDCRDQDIEGKTFNGCTFIGVQFSAAKVSRCKIVGCKFQRCDLSNARLRGSSFRDLAFEDSKLIGINWTEAAAISHLIFERCVLNYSIFEGLDLRKGRLFECIAREIDLTGTNLSSADCRKTDFAGSRFSRTNLAQADLRDAINYAMRPCDNILKDAKFSLPEATSLLHGLGIAIDE